MARISWERLAALAGLAFVVLYVAAFALGIEVGDSDREILDYYGDSGNRAKEVVAFFLIAGAALSLAVFATALRSIITRFEHESPNALRSGLGGRNRLRRTYPHRQRGLSVHSVRGDGRGLPAEPRHARPL